MRGKPPALSIQSLAKRITPAHAGKTRYSTDTLDVYQDHPRACGENLLREFGVIEQLGSPPRMRGKLIEGIVKGILNRITPAHAGKTVGQV